MLYLWSGISYMFTTTVMILIIIIQRRISVPKDLTIGIISTHRIWSDTLQVTMTSDDGRQTIGLSEVSNDVIRVVGIQN